MNGIDPKQVKAARTRQLAAARRSLKLVTDTLPGHVAALADGVTPEDGFLTSALKYEQARLALLQLDALGSDAGGDEALVSREYLGIFLQVLAEFGVDMNVPADTPLGQLLAAAGQPATDGQEG